MNWQICIMNLNHEFTLQLEIQICCHKLVALTLHEFVVVFFANLYDALVPFAVRICCHKLQVEPGANLWSPIVPCKLEFV
jgi:hypothetical protein